MCMLVVLNMLFSIYFMQDSGTRCVTYGFLFWDIQVDKVYDVKLYLVLNIIKPILL